MEPRDDWPTAGIPTQGPVPWVHSQGVVRTPYGMPCVRRPSPLWVDRWQCVFAHTLAANALDVEIPFLLAGIGGAQRRAFFFPLWLGGNGASNMR